MAWIESHQALEKHPKVLMLMSLMKWNKDTTIGKLHRFWWWCVTYAEDGDLQKYHVDQIGAAVDISPGEESGMFANNMVQAKWIDLKPYCRVHDWWHYIGRFLQVKYKLHPEKWERVRALYTDIPNNPPNNGDSNHIPNLTIPNLTIPNLTINSKQAITPALKAVLDKVYKEGLNIYALMNKMKKQIGWKPDQHFPEGVLIRVCEQYHKDKAKIKDQWPWFCRVLKAETERYYAEKNISDHKAIKQTGAMSLAQILSLEKK